MTVGSLFTGIGGFDLGFARAGFDIRWQCECDPFCRAVLQRHWPGVTRYWDVRQLYAPDTVDVICGGFPCQPHSSSGQRRGDHDDRDLWSDFARIICDVRPQWIVAENVVRLLATNAGRFYGTILRDLAACGYDAEWDCLPASAFGAPHRRDRIWIVAYTRCVGAQISPARVFTAKQKPQRDLWWKGQSDLDRMADGVPARLDRLRALGNAVVPQIAEWIARRILDAESREQG